MANPFPLQTSFTGIWRDAPRNELPPGKLWNCIDMIPEQLGAPLRRRGGWTYASPALGSATDVMAVAYCPFAAGEKYVAAASDGNAYQYTSGTSASLGTAFTDPGDLVFHRTGAPSLGTLIITDRLIVTAPKSWDRTTFGALGGTPPVAAYATIWNDRVLFANGKVGGTAFPSRVWFGPAGNSASTWDTTNAWIDTVTDVTGIATVGSSILVFHPNSTELIRGTTPPSSTTVGDLTLSRLFDVGCKDNRSIIRYNDTVVWADIRGIYQTDGATLKDLTRVGGISGYWRDTATAGSYSGITTAIFNDTLFVSVTDGSSSSWSCAYDFLRGLWWQFANFPFLAGGRVGAASEQTHVGLRGYGRVASMGPMFSPTTANRVDPINAFVGRITTGGFHGFMRMNRRWLPSHGIQNWKALFVDYDLRDAAAVSPTLTVKYGTDPTQYPTVQAGSTLAATTKPDRKRRALNTNGAWLVIDIQADAGATDFSLYALEADYSPRETSRLS